MHKSWFLPMFSNLTCCSIFHSFIVDSLCAHVNVHRCKNQVVFSSQYKDGYLAMAFTKCSLQRVSATSQSKAILGYNTTQQLESTSMNNTPTKLNLKLDKIVASICTIDKQKGVLRPSNVDHNMIDLRLLKPIGSRCLRPHKIEDYHQQLFGYKKWFDINFMNKVSCFGTMCGRNDSLLHHHSRTCVNSSGIVGTEVQGVLTFIYGWLSGDVNIQANLIKPKATGVKGPHGTKVSFKFNMMNIEI